MLNQCYQTVVCNPTQRERSLWIISVPRRSFPSSSSDDWWGVITRWLGTNDIAYFRMAGQKFPNDLAPGIAPGSLSMVLASIVTPAQLGLPYEVVADNIQAVAQGRVPDNLDATDLSFAEEVAVMPLVPFERSPLASETVATLVVEAAQEKYGYNAGVVRLDGKPLLIVAHRDGIVILGPALDMGASQPTMKGVWERIIEWIFS